MGNSNNINYDNVDLGIKSQIIDEFKKIYLDEVKERCLHYHQKDGKPSIIMNNTKISFNSIQSLIELVKNLNRPFIIDEDETKVCFIYGLK